MIDVGFEISGMDLVIKKFNTMEKATDATCKQAVKAGAQYVANCLQEEAPRDTGALQKSIKVGRVRYSAADGFYCEVKPHGNHPETGEPLAKIGNILEYGRSDLIALAWFHPTVKAVEKDTIEVMRYVVDSMED